MCLRYRLLQEDEKTTKEDEEADDGAGVTEVARVCGGLARAWGARAAGGSATRAGGALLRLLGSGAPAARLLETRRTKYTGTLRDSHTNARLVVPVLHNRRLV